MLRTHYNNNIMRRIDITIFAGTLLDVIPHDIKLIINEEVLNIIRYEKQCCIDAHKKLGLSCCNICHLCKINMAKFDIEKKHWVCSECINHKKYLKCQICVNEIKSYYDAFRFHYDYEISDEELLEYVKKNKHSSVSWKQCCFCISMSDILLGKYCIMCHSKCGNNFIKAYHETIYGKKIIYFCKNMNCEIYSEKIIHELITQFDNPDDRAYIMARYVIDKWANGESDG